MNRYAQPSDYHFSHDSIELAARAADILSVHFATPRSPLNVASKSPSVFHPVRGLDLCAGCGVVGLELVRRLWRRDSDRRPESLASWRIDFTEVQSVYVPFFEQNRNEVRAELSTNLRAPQNIAAKVQLTEVWNWNSLNYRELLNHPGGVYDWIVSNPPYFDPYQGKLPPSDFKARCRFFIDSDFETLCQVIVHGLAPGGVALFLVRDLDRNQRRNVLDRVLGPNGSWLELEPIRGTSLVQFVREVFRA